jgi:drug/metabolite transporter (DMT)-like permease
VALGVFLIVLASAALHATWNAVIRGASDRLLTTILIAGSAALVALCALPFLPPVSAQSWPYLAVSAVLEITYYALVGLAYSHAEMSHAYPLMRGTPPLIVATVSALALNTGLHPAGWAGVALISAGILSLAFTGSRRHDRRGTHFALANALVIAAYTLVDGVGVRTSGQPATYAMWIFILTGVPLAAWAVLRRPEILSYARRNWHFGLIGGLGTLSSYGIVLWAMTVAPIPLVAALRETSILFGTAIAFLILKEAVTAPRIVAVLFIAAGAAVMRLA